MHFYIIGLVVVVGVFICSCLCVLFWAAQTGRFQELEQGARVVFTPDEPEGVNQDHFPAKSKK